MDVAADGKPGTATLGEAYISSPDCLAVSAQFYNQAIYLRAGQRYTIELSTQTPLTGGLIDGFDGSYPSAYPNGTLWSRESGDDQWRGVTVFDDGVTEIDLRFETYMFRGVPEAQLVEPAPGSRFTTADAISMRAVTHLPGAQISEIIYFADNVEIGRSAAYPFSYHWINPIAGTQALSARVRIGESNYATEAVPVNVRVPGPSNDDLQAAIALTQEHLEVRGNIENATLEPGESKPTPDSSGRTAWWRWTAPNSGPVFLSTQRSAEPELALAVYTGSSFPSLVRVGGGITRCSFEAVAGVSYAIQVDSMAEAAQEIVLNVAMADQRITAPTVGSETTAPALITVAASETTRPIAEVAINAGALTLARFQSPPYSASVLFDNPGYFDLVAVATDGNGISTTSPARRVVVRPQNDHIANAIPVEGYSGSVHGSIRAATGQTLDPHYADNQGSRSIWYRWRAPASGLLTLEGEGLTHGIFWVLGISNGGSIGVVAENSTGDPRNRIEASVTAGITYHFMLDSFFFEEGEVDWTYSLAPFNDRFDGGVMVVSDQFATLGVARNASIQENEPPAAGGDGLRLGTLWWRWNPPLSGPATITATSPTPVGISVFRGSAVATLTTVASDSAIDGEARLSFDAVKGELYHVRVSGDATSTAQFELRFTMPVLRVTSPLPGSVHRGPARILLNAAFSTGEPVHDVVFTANNADLTGLNQSPSGAFVWENVPAGSYQIKARGVTEGGVPFESALTTILVYANDTIPAPRLYAGSASDASFVIDAVGALYSFGERSLIFSAYSHPDPNFPALTTPAAGVAGWAHWNSAFTRTGPQRGRGDFAITDDGRLFDTLAEPLGFPPDGGKWIFAHGGWDIGSAPEPAGFYAVTDDGRVFADGRRIAALTQDKMWVQFFKGYEACYGLTSEGDAFCFAPGLVGDLVRTQFEKPAGLQRIARMDVTLNNGIICMSDEGQLYSGDMLGGVLTLVSRPAGVNQWRSFSCGGYHVMAIGDNGKLYTWGGNQEGQLGYPGQYDRATPTLTPFPPGVTVWLQVAGGHMHSLALANDFSLYAWGANNKGQLGTGQVSRTDTPTRVANLENLCGAPVIFFDAERSRLEDGSFSVSFDTILNRSVLIQYSSDMETWLNATPSIIGTGNRITWIDDGPPKTLSHPATETIRFYRVIHGQ